MKINGYAQRSLAVLSILICMSLFSSPGALAQRATIVYSPCASCMGCLAFCPHIGDINDDGVVDISDAILVLRTALALDPVKPCSDINNDGSVDISDVILTLRIALGLDPLRQCGG
jgi:hypothetical protein